MSKCSRRDGWLGLGGLRHKPHTGEHVSAFGKTAGGRIILQCHECWHMWYSVSRDAFRLYKEKFGE